MTQELDANTRIPRRWSEERWSQGRDVADEIVSQDDVRHDPGEPAPGEGPEGVKQLVQTLRTFTPDLRITIEDMVTEGESVAMRSVTSGTDTGGRMGRAPTGRVTHIVGMQFFRIRGARLWKAGRFVTT